jgi:hypothetical protein
MQYLFMNRRPEAETRRKKGDPGLTNPSLEVSKSVFNVHTKS